jgi:TetR/AcrR family transcriptional repressor of nem operon
MSKAERTRQMIIEHAAPIFNEKGVAGTSVDDVLKSANVAKGCLYGHFESKDELAYASLDYMLGKMRERRELLVSSQNTAKEKLFAYLEMQKNPLNPMFRGGCPILNFGAEADDTNPVIKEKIQNFLAYAIKILEDIVRQGIQNQEFVEELNPKEFALKFFGAIEGGIMMCRITQSLNPMQGIAKSLKSEIESYSRGANTLPLNTQSNTTA